VNKSYVGTIIGSAPGITIRNAVSVHVEPEAYDVTLDYIDRNGQKVTSLDRFSQPPVVLAPYTGNDWPVQAKGGKLVARLPKGTSFSVTENITTPGKDEVAPSITTISNPSFAVTANTTVTLDARKAKKVDVKLDADATPEFWQMLVTETTPDGQYGSFVLAFPSPPEAYVLATAPVASRKYQFSYFQEAEAGDKTYETVVSTAQRLPADPTYLVKDSDLAEVDFSLYSGGKPLTGLFGHGMRYDTNGLRFEFGYEREVEIPSSRKHLVTTSVNGSAEALWSGYLFGVDSGGGSVFFQGESERAYSGSAEARQVRYLDPAYGAIAGGDHDGEGILQLGVEPLTSASGPLVPSEQQFGGLVLRRNGTPIAQATNPTYIAATGVTGTATYTLEVEAGHNLPWMNYARQVTGSWTFTSTKPSPGTYTPLSLVAPRVTGAFDLNGNAPAGSSFPLVVRSESGTPSLTNVELSISYDDGVTWRALTLTPDSGDYKATAPLPNVASGYASLRVKATGGEPTSTADLTILRAFGIKRVS
jgi:hypothetical protein